MKTTCVRWPMCLSTYFYLAYRCLALSKFFCHRGKHRCLNHPVYRLLIDQYLIILIILKNYPCLGLLEERHTVIDYKKTGNCVRNLNTGNGFLNSSGKIRKQCFGRLPPSFFLRILSINQANIFLIIKLKKEVSYERAIETFHPLAEKTGNTVWKSCHPLLALLWNVGGVLAGAVLS